MVNRQIPKAHLVSLLISLGMTPSGLPFSGSHAASYAVLLDGKIVGRVHEDDSKEFLEKLRYLKVTGKEKVRLL